ncbi:Oidioi.mRNA.OKI2018_I69.XSR.g16468.t1.cds [Oikopleura dioica]|uniref:Oidioi.mRNA.OKI2018_I69.XSR.g16468.t1.cds n=1 Tax=Oikopleura dioica TaxID=34765 RepID=A0ABN7SL16_OIKDI|nr:Oidioi.mRNA.OKI2018_I69.XSR.g16468.t1.cds [Oikopleura dioica]
MSYTIGKLDLEEPDRRKKIECRGDAVFFGYLVAFLVPFLIGTLVFSTPWIIVKIVGKSEPQDQPQNLKTGKTPTPSETKWFWDSSLGQLLCSCCTACSKNMTDQLSPIEHPLFEVHSLSASCTSSGGKYQIPDNFEKCPKLCDQSDWCSFFVLDAEQEYCKILEDCTVIPLRDPSAISKN